MRDSRQWQGALPGVRCYGSLLRRCAAPRRDSAPWLLYDGWQMCLACRTSRVAGALFCNARGWHTLAATPHHFTTTSHPGACVGAPAWRRRVPRVKPEPEPNWPKVCVITSIDNYCKSTALRALHAQNIRKQRRLSLLRLPIVAEAAQQVQKPPRLSAGAARASWPARPNINKCPRRMHPKKSLMD